jgi:hypothetical protein
MEFYVTEEIEMGLEVYCVWCNDTKLATHWSEMKAVYHMKKLVAEYCTPPLAA